MPTYRTPDVYVEEISVFPPSVAEVETAVPAFVGYTAKATRLFNNDLQGVPTRLTSLPEFESLFGGAPRVAVQEVVLDDANRFVRGKVAPSNQKYLYDSMRLFFDNGGGKCYVTSVGSHGEETNSEALIKGLDAVARQDEPTILLFPDAAALGDDDLAKVQQQALAQCGKLKDRVALLDVRESDPNGERLRDKLGINHLKYGAAYSPWLRVGYPKTVRYADVKSVLQKGGASVGFKDLTSDSEVVILIDRLDGLLDDVAGMTARLAAATGAGKSVSDRFVELTALYKANKTAANTQALFGYLYGLARVFEGMLASNGGLKDTTHRSHVDELVTGTLKKTYTDLIALEKELDGKIDGYTPQWDVGTVPSNASWGKIFSDSSPAASTTGIPATADTDAKRTDAALVGVNKAFSAVSTALSDVVTGATAWVDTTEASLLERFPLLREVIRGVKATLTVCPPSGAIAGVYAAVDTARGVWKAPANVSLSGVVEPAYYFASDETDKLNVDVDAGKSINAIRFFSGKGTLVWGARTLAGNDNEWRYISVRRFFNMVQESVKKSTYFAVFEPNDANTWVKVRGMIENYLTQKWREGALAGATTKEAFFVRCGLGVTMNAQDILEGRMIVEIGMAVVRPAEFIILRFSHKQQTS